MYIMRTSQKGPSPRLGVLIIIILVVLAGIFFCLYPGKVHFNIAHYLPGGDEVTLIFVGDIMLSRNIGKTMMSEDNWNYFFESVEEYLTSADLTFGNFENPMSDRGTNVGSIYSFRVDPHAVEGLVNAGFDVLSLANNHIWDWGPDAFEDTRNILTDNGIRYVGVGDDYVGAHTPVIKEVKGTKVAYLAYTNLVPGFLNRMDSTPAVASPEIEGVARDIQYAKSLADIVVVSYHWGEEYQTTHNADQERRATGAIDAGADLVIGHHPHVVQEVVPYKQGYIAYSLGNFIFDQNFSADTSWGLTLKVTIKDKKIATVEQVPVTFNKNYQPSL
jgi:poly-gamma-glutamate capsule biosynthesis protein CapA/YwtB (metallophosphatase superfamily)